MKRRSRKEQTKITSLAAALKVQILGGQEKSGAQILSTALFQLWIISIFNPYHQNCNWFSNSRANQETRKHQHQSM